MIHRLVKESEGASFMDVLCGGKPHSQQDTGYSVSGKDAKKLRKNAYPLAMESFMDTKTTAGKYDYSEWVRAYCRFIDESLDTYFHTSWYAGLEKNGKESLMRSLEMEELLQQLPRIQKIQRRLVDCVPRGAACQNDNTLVRVSN